MAPLDWVTGPFFFERTGAATSAIGARNIPPGKARGANGLAQPQHERVIILEDFSRGRAHQFSTFARKTA